eukprot:scaffold152967_cov56-Attheya_sp.AAC.1
MGYGYRARLVDVFQLGCPIDRRGRGWGLGVAFSGPGAVGDAGAMAGMQIVCMRSVPLSRPNRPLDAI